MRRLILVVAFMVSACVSVEATQTHAACETGAQEQIVAEMFFGRNIGQTLGVSDEDWRAFVDTEVTPRFGDGLTMYDAQGQWRDSDTGAIVREPSKVLLLILVDAQDRADVAAIAEAYKARFQQQAVAVMSSRRCVAFR